MYYYNVDFLLNKGFINVYTIKLIKQINDRPHGIINNNAGIIISILQSFVSVILSKSSVIFVIFIY